MITRVAGVIGGLLLLLSGGAVAAQAITTLAGSDLLGYQDGLGASALFRDPSGLALDAAGNLYVADMSNHCIRKIAPNGLTSTLTGQCGVGGFADGVAALAQFNLPTGLVFDPNGNLLVTDWGNGLIRQIAADGSVTTLAGDTTLLLAVTPGIPIGGYLDGPALGAQFNGPNDLVFDALGNLLISDSNNHVIRQLSANGLVTTLAGSGVAGFADGVGTAAQFNFPYGLALDSGGVIYIADQWNNRIRKLTPDGSVTTLAGDGTWGFLDGAAATAQFGSPAELALDSSGTLYIADQDNMRLRQITPDGTVTTLAGDGSFSFQDGPVATAQLVGPAGLLLDGSGTLFFSDPGVELLSSRIRKLVTVEAMLQIEAGLTYTNRVTVALDLLCRSSALSGSVGDCRQMQFSNDGVTWSVAEAYAASKLWSLAAGGDGLRTIWVQFLDQNGVLLTGTSASITLDTVPPATPLISAPLDGSLSNLAEQPPISGTAEPGASVSVFDGQLLLGEVVAAASGDWSLPAAGSLSEGLYSFTAEALDEAGNLSSLSSPVSYQIDLTPPQLTLNPDTAAPLYVGDNYTDPGATAVDNLDGDLSAAIAVSGSVDMSQKGSYALTYRVSDAAGNLSEAVRTVTVILNSPPTITAVEVAAGVLNEAYLLQFQIDDVEGDPVTLSAINLPAWATLDSVTGQLSGTPDVAGLYADITLTVADNWGTSSYGPFSIDVQPLQIYAGSGYLRGSNAQPDNGSSAGALGWLLIVSLMVLGIVNRRA